MTTQAGSWSLQELSRSASERALQSLSEHHADRIDFFDSTISFLLDPVVGWVHPLLDARAQDVEKTRIDKANSELWLPPGSAASEERLFGYDSMSIEAVVSHALHDITFAFVRDLAKTGLLVIQRLLMEALSTYRRATETLQHLDVLLERSDLARECLRAGRDFTRSERRGNRFLRAVDETFRRAVEPNLRMEEQQKLSEFQHYHRQRSSDAMLNTGVHAGIQHGLFKHVKPHTYSLFDDNLTDPTAHLWRFAAEGLRVAEMFVERLPAVSKDVWKERIHRLHCGSQAIEDKLLETNPSQQRGSAPWSSYRQEPM
ncbi:MAG: hypothetical protein H6832_04600 [Planctomycetes bacterium]|nr:hypothetical protein [Planctomycetota bacterium]